MGESIQQMTGQLNEFWNNLEKKKKIKLIVGSLLLLISITALILFITRTKYTVLYSGLNLSEAATVTKKLDEINIQWKDENNGTTILVPENMVSKAKMELAAEGIPKGRYGREDALNDSSWTMTEYDKKQRANYGRENDLALDIEKIDGVEEASVFLNIPESTSYILNNAEKPSASVFVTLSRGKTLTANQVRGIQDHVGRAVGMEPENVSVVDDSGRVLTVTDENQEEFDLTEQLNMQQGIQERINKSIKDFLESVFGYGNVVVRSGVKVNFDSEFTSIQEFNPPVEGMEEGLVRSMEKIEEQMENMIEGGIPGVDSNVDDITDYVQQNGENSKYNKASETINFELNEINKQIRRAPGQVESITVAIILNKDALPDSELTDDFRKEIADLIYAATGLDTKQVEVSAMKFNDTLLAEDNLVKKVEESGQSWLWYLLLAIPIIGGVATVIIIRRRKREEADINEIIEQKASEMAIVEDIDFDSEKSKVKEQISKFVDKKPDAVAQLLRTWLNED
ncbi:Flagellar M-ring protein [Proteiniborus sp. DW1]|uniref:flagellar basal-body MS-ring/collar protein FliF n=1 Tax=Proteiniborus sp. DW1 TaxID=1889883 RepID=UPI00092DFC07|nr:flagellar basal-body MS-ring/collar protein FliF [Proteiniborus sp. DW1]SCG83455.1 Flagellar M-ring protein [Proteiniborus sp. DW1]